MRTVWPAPVVDEPVIDATAPVNPVVVPDWVTFRRIAPVCDAEAFVMLTTFPAVVPTPATANTLPAPVVPDPVNDTRLPVYPVVVVV